MSVENMPQSIRDTYWSEVKANPDLSISQRRVISAKYTRSPVIWSCEVPRTREGYYHYRAGFPAATKRAKVFAPYADLLWIETSTPDLKKAAELARNIRRTHSDKKLVYNLSPSFNWIGEGFDEESLKSFVWELAKHGYERPCPFWPS